MSDALERWTVGNGSRKTGTMRDVLKDSRRLEWLIF